MFIPILAIIGWFLGGWIWSILTGVDLDDSNYF